MATVSKFTPASVAAPAPVQSVNSSHDSHSRQESPSHSVLSLADCSSPSPFSGISDREQLVASEFVPCNAIKPPAATASFLSEDAQPEGSDQDDDATKKRVWNKPANGVGAVMGAKSWPALSKSSTDSSEELSLGSLTLSKRMSVDSLSSGEVFNTNPASERKSLSRQTSMEQGSGSLSPRNITANGSFSQEPNSSSSVTEASLVNPVKSSSSVGGSPRNNAHWDVGQRGGSYSGHEPHQQRGPVRRNNSGPLLQGNGSSNHSHDSKRDQERWKQDWSNNNRSFGSRVNHVSQQSPPHRVASRPFIRAPISNAPFIPLPPHPMAIRPYGPPVFYNDPSSFMYYAPGPHPGSLRHMPMVPFAPIFYPIHDPHLPSKIVSQIDYYFSDDNLVKDTFLRQKMNVDGWVPISLIANFKKVRELTDNVQLILDALRASNVVEIQAQNVRRKGNWKKWIMRPIV